MEIPSISVVALDVRTLGTRTRSALLDALAATGFEQGYVRARLHGRDWFLFVRDGRAWCAGTFEGGSPTQLSVREFLERAADFESVEVCKTDLALFLCAAVIFRKPPAAHVPAALVDADALMKSVAALGKDAVLALRTDNAWALAFCRSGEPVALYTSPSLRPTSPSTLPAPASARALIADQLLDIVYTRKDRVTIDVYDEIRLPPAGDAGQTIAELRGALPETLPLPTLLVLLGDRLVFRHRLDREETIIGRGQDAHLALDNLSVSRHHAVVRFLGLADDGSARIVVDDLGSENGLVVRATGARVKQLELKPGARVDIGKYTIAHALPADSVERSDPRRPALSSDIDTISMQARPAILEHDGNQHKVASAIFTIGSARDASLRINGFFVAGIQAVLQADRNGYRVERIGKTRKMRVNGVVTDQKRLADGDVIVIAGETMCFRDRAFAAR